ncbi:hypothetical protein B0J17DRAFT_718539 [Rhizoctonia solani]|nr:hypothetical protein B0J17DRAFT_718539 [Rhizoctonia solani]
MNTCRCQRAILSALLRKLLFVPKDPTTPPFHLQPFQMWVLNDSGDEMGTDDALGKSKTDTKMIDRYSNFDDIPDRVQGISVQRVKIQDPTPNNGLLKGVPNLFRLLDLVDEQGSGGIVEKAMIDQTSLHRILNILQPGSYDFIPKINFKELDNICLSIAY